MLKKVLAVVVLLIPLLVSGTVVGVQVSRWQVARARLAQVQVGMTQDEVEAILGAPVSRAERRGECPKLENWVAPGDIRLQVRFDEQDRVQYTVLMPNSRNEIRALLDRFGW
jgi:hypothetical protein